jgi:parvulin-like peptidyl-prolyl isomerase
MSNRVDDSHPRRRAGSDAPTPNAGLEKPRRVAVAREWLATRGLWPSVWREKLTDETIADVELSDDEKSEALAEAERRWKESAEQLAPYGMRREDLEFATLRERRLRKFKREKWGAALPAYFLKRKSALDEAVYWLLRLDDRMLARELYFRIKEGEEDFSSVAARHSLGSEARTCGIVGPVALGSMAPALAKLILESKPGKLRPPVRIGEWTVVIRLQALFPAKLDAAMEERLCDELFEQWLDAQIRERAAS